MSYRETPIKKDASWRGKRGTWPFKKQDSTSSWPGLRKHDSVSSSRSKTTKSHEELLGECVQNYSRCIEEQISEAEESVAFVSCGDASERRGSARGKNLAMRKLSSLCTSRSSMKFKCAMCTAIAATPKSEKSKKKFGDFFKLDSLRKKKRRRKQKATPDGGFVTASEETLDLDKSRDSRDSIPMLDDEPVRRCVWRGCAWVWARGVLARSGVF